jgi:hypothetical protein
VDTYNTESCSKELHISAGLDVLFHSMESWTAIPCVRSSRSIIMRNTDSFQIHATATAPGEPEAPPCLSRKQPRGGCLLTLGAEDHCRRSCKTCHAIEFHPKRRRLSIFLVSQKTPKMRRPGGRCCELDSSDVQDLGSQRFAGLLRLLPVLGSEQRASTCVTA